MMAQEFISIIISNPPKVIDYFPSWFKDILSLIFWKSEILEFSKSENAAIMLTTASQSARYQNICLITIENNSILDHKYLLFYRF